MKKCSLFILVFLFGIGIVNAKTVDLYEMMKENASNYGMSPLLKSFLLVLVFGIVAMPFAGLSLILRRDSGLVTRVIGLGMLLVAIATWGYLVYYSIHWGFISREQWRKVIMIKLSWLSPKVRGYTDIRSGSYYLERGWGECCRSVNSQRYVRSVWRPCITTTK